MLLAGSYLATTTHIHFQFKTEFDTDSEGILQNINFVGQYPIYYSI